jgi:AcrR family transcriptional regulator
VTATNILASVNDVKEPRPPRREQAARTRTRILDAAYELFCESGFRATTMAAIATRAGVAVQTVYFTFHTKDELVQAIHERAVLGDTALPPPLQSWHTEAMQQPDIADAVQGIVIGTATILARVAPMVPAYHAVAHEPAGQLWHRSEDLRLQGMLDLVGVLSRKAPIRPGLTRKRAADILFVLLGPDLYRTIVIERGWTTEEWARLTERSILREVFSTSSD